MIECTATVKSWYGNGTGSSALPQSILEGRVLSKVDEGKNTGRNKNTGADICVFEMIIHVRLWMLYGSPGTQDFGWSITRAGGFEPIAAARRRIRMAGMLHPCTYAFFESLL